jgi:uncharacterized protein (TIGR00369 family)
MDAENLLERIPYARLLGVRIEQTPSGMICVLPFREEIVGNPLLPAVHGGAVGAFLELTALVHLIGESPSERLPKPINFNIDYLRSAREHTTKSKALIVKHGRRIANVRVEAWQIDSDKTIAIGVGNFLL